ncbi:MAG TPA: hypothetical protein VJH20_01220 [Candidatus Nanoarchaeia archaeon]|nr:hypothetical protein [Candidatus Nanoarchaeia archaeon]
MIKKLAKDLKVNDRIKVYDGLLIVEKTEHSAIAKHGKSKVRLDTINEKTQEKGVLIVLATDEFEVVN